MANVSSSENRHALTQGLATANMTEPSTARHVPRGNTLSTYGGA